MELVLFGVVQALQSCRQAIAGKREVCGGPWLPLRFRRMLCRGAKLCLAVSPSTMFCPQAHGLVLKEALRSAWLQWASHGGLTTCFSTRPLKAAGLQCIGLVLKEALRSAWLHGQVSVAD